MIEISNRKSKILLYKLFTARQMRQEQLTLNEQMLNKNLLPSQIHRFNLYLVEMEKQMASSDLEMFNVSKPLQILR